MSERLRAILRGYFYLAPNLIGFLVFTAFPVIAVGIMAFFHGNFTTRVRPETGRFEVAAVYTGLGNFKLLRDELRGESWTEEAGPEGKPVKIYHQEGELRRALRNTFVLLIAIPLQMGASLGLAMLLNRKIRGRVVFRTLLFIPSIASGIAMYLVWRWIFNQDFGLLNAVLGTNEDWLGNSSLVKPAIIFMSVWTTMGGTNMVLYLAGLQGIDPTLYEAAEIDGANALQKFVHVTWPELRPTTFFILTTNLIGGFQIFDQVLVMTNGGPEGASTTILYYVYQNMYVYEGKLGYASALAIFLFAIIFMVTLVNYFFSRGGALAVRS